MNTPEKGRQNLCPEARSLLPAYVEHELTAVESTRVQCHLDVCAACRQEEIAFRHALRTLREAPKPVHGNLYAGLNAKLDGLNRRPAFRPKQLRWAGALACLVLAAGVGATVVGRTLFHKEAEPVPVPIVTSSNPLAYQVKSLVKKERAPSTTPVAPKVDRDPFAPVTVEVTPDSDSTSAGDPSNSGYVAEDSGPSESRRRHRSRAHYEEFDPSQYTDIRKVRAKNGETLEDVMNRLKKDGHYSLGGSNQQYSTPQTGSPAPDPAPSKNLPAASIDDPSLPDVAVVVPEKEKSETVGEKVVTSSRAEGFDKTGRLALIRLDAEAAPKPKSKVPPRRSLNDEGR